LLFWPLAVATVGLLQFLIVHRRSTAPSWVKVWCGIPLLAVGGALPMALGGWQALKTPPPPSGGPGLLGVAMILVSAATVWTASSGVLFAVELVRRLLWEEVPREPS
jgi:hypothetical protein